MVCRICRSDSIEPMLDLGDMPLVNALHATRDDAISAKRYPLRAIYCRKCGLVQLDSVIPWQTLYADYPFFTSSSKRMVEHYIAQMDEYTKNLERNDFVVEIGSNDGSVFRGMARKDLRRVGVDPANMPCYLPFARHIKSAFTENLVTEHMLPIYGKAKLIVANNVLGHVDDVHDFIEGVRNLLHDDGLFVFEVPYLGDTLERCAYDQFYHEHLSYFSMRPIHALLDAHQMQVYDDSMHNTHGGSIRIVARHGTLDDEPWLCDSELGTFYNRIRRFSGEFWEDRRELSLRLLRAQERGDVIGYGASAKSAIVLNACSIDDNLITRVVDSTPAKIGKFIPGTGQWIIDEKDAKLRSAGGIVLFAWNHDEEIRAKHPNVRKSAWIYPHRTREDQ